MNRLLHESLGFILAIDGCARGCTHCPAFSLGQRPVMAPIETLRERLTRVKQSMPNVDFARFRTIHAWRISDLADYHWQAGGTHYDVASVAELWCAILGQPLYVVTNGSMGSRRRQESLKALAQQPELVSQVKLTVTPFDTHFYRPNYVANMAADIAALWPLTQLPAVRHELQRKAIQPRFRINVKANDDQHEIVRETLGAILTAAGLDRLEAECLLTGLDPRLQIKPVYDLRVQVSQPVVVGAKSLGDSIETRCKSDQARSRHQLGFRPSGQAMHVDMWGFTEEDIQHSGQRTFEDWFPARQPAAV